VALEGGGGGLGLLPGLLGLALALGDAVLGGLDLGGGGHHATAAMLGASSWHTGHFTMRSSLPEPTFTSLAPPQFEQLAGRMRPTASTRRPAVWAADALTWRKGRLDGLTDLGMTIPLP
jgi:hypothetical protein